MKTFETFREFGPFEEGQITQRKPSCFNGMVRVTKYRVTIEEVDEPDEVIHKRLQRLWDESDNHHQSVPLRNAAERHGYELKGPRGSKRRNG